MDVSCKIFLFELFISLKYSKSHKLLPMIFIAYFLVRDIPLSFTIDLLCLIKLLLHLDDLHASIFLLSFAFHSQFVGLGNPLGILVHDLLIGGMTDLSYWDEFPMVSTLMCMVTHWTGSTMSHGLRLSRVMTSPSCFIVVSFNLERILNLC